MTGRMQDLFERMADAFPGTLRCLELSEWPAGWRVGDPWPSVSMTLVASWDDQQSPDVRFTVAASPASGLDLVRISVAGAFEGQDVWVSALPSAVLLVAAGSLRPEAA